MSSSASSGNSGSPVPIGGRALALEAGQAIEHMHGVIGAALFAVIDDVEAAFDLLLHDVGDGLAHRGVERGLVLAWLLALRQQQVDDLLRARQAAGMGGEDAA